MLSLHVGMRVVLLLLKNGCSCISAALTGLQCPGMFVVQIDNKYKKHRVTPLFNKQRNTIGNKVKHGVVVDMVLGSDKDFKS